MKRLRAIIESAFPPPTDSLWLYNSSIRYFTGGKWIALTSEIGDISYNDLTDLPDLSIYATINQLNTKQDTLVSGTSIKTINGQSLLGTGNIQVDGPDGNTTYTFTDGTDGSFTVTPSQGEPQKVSIGTFKTINGDSIFNEGDTQEDIEVVADINTPTAEASSIDSGQRPTVNVSSTGEGKGKVFHFTFQIPKGEKGEQGEKGNDGTGIALKATAGECTQAGDAYINQENGHIMIYNGSSFTDGGEIKGPKGDTGAAGAAGTPAGFGTPTATANTLEAGLPASVQVATSGGNTNKVFAFTFGIPKGEKGDKGDKGDTGATGADGAPGATGATPNITINATVDANTGTPSVDVTKGGTTANPVINLAFHNLKGENGLDGEDASINLTQQMPGKVMIFPNSKNNVSRPTFNINDASNSYYIEEKNQLRFSPGDSVIDGDGKVWAIVSVSNEGMNGTGGNDPAFQLSIVSA